MLCTVVIPLYNKADFIGATLRSVLNQTHGNFEIIVVNDGSTDDSVQRVRAFNDQRIVLIDQPNSGVSCARNRGIASANGELVCFLDADDCFHPVFLQTVVDMAREHPEDAFFATGFHQFWDDEVRSFLNEDQQVAPSQRIENFFKVWRKQAVFCTDSVAIRRHALLALQPCFPPGESMAEDQDLWFRLVERHGVRYCTTPLVAYRRNIQTSLTAISAAQRTGLRPTYARLEQRARTRQMPAQHVREALRLVADKRITVARSTLAAGQRKEALKQLLHIKHALLLRRWWLSLLICLTGGASLMQYWENTRAPKIHEQPLHRNREAME